MWDAACGSEMESESDAGSVFEKVSLSRFEMAFL
jgi:hypothetical protein